MDTDTTLPRWRRLNELGPPKQDIDHVLMSLAWTQPIVCRWNGSRWRTRAPSARRGTNLMTRQGRLEQPGWCIELPSLVDQVQAQIDASRNQVRELFDELGLPLEAEP